MSRIPGSKSKDMCCVVNRGVSLPCRVFNDHSNKATEITPEKACEIEELIIFVGSGDR
jgi:hypothetical protein